MARYGQGSSCELARASEIKMSNKLRVGIVTSVGPLGTIPERFVQFGRWVEGIPRLRGWSQAARAFTEAISVERRQICCKVDNYWKWTWWPPVAVSISSRDRLALGCCEGGCEWCVKAQAGGKAGYGRGRRHADRAECVAVNAILLE